MRISDWSSDVCSSDLVNARLEAIDVEIGALVDRPISFDPADMAHAGAFMSIEVDGSLRIERGYVRPEDEPAADDTMGDPERTVDPETGEIRTAPDGSSPTGPAVAPVGTASSDDDDADDEMVKPIPDKMVSALTGWRDRKRVG